MRSLAPALLGQQPKRVLILDDEPAVVQGLRRVLNQFGKKWHCETATDPEDAWYHIVHTGCDVLVTDIRMPKIDGLALLERMQRDPKTEGIPVIIVTGLGDEALKIKALELGAVDLLTKPVDAHYLAARIEQALRWKEGLDVLSVLNSRLKSLTRRQKVEIAQHQLGTLSRLVVLIEHRNPVLSRHSLRVAHLSRRLGEELGLPAEECAAIFWAGALHDVGKVVLPDALLERDVPLSPGEAALLEKHCLFGEQILRGRSTSPVAPAAEGSPSPGERSVIDIAAEVALYHHERWDGSGFPHGRAKDEIPPAARLVALCNVFDHLAHNPRGTPSEDDVKRELSNQSGAHLDPQLTAGLLAHWEAFWQLAEKLRTDTKAERGTWTLTVGSTNL